MRTGTTENIKNLKEENNVSILNCTVYIHITVSSIMHFDNDA
jgi:hypothetical protein